MSKFEYSPGIAGWGTTGAKGDNGVQGLATYFSAYDGNTDSISIKAKIVANKILFPIDELLPGYPTRVYKTGDQFIDKNGKVFQIDFDELILYKPTNQQLNTSGFFELGPNTINTPVYSRYSNAFTSSKFLIDVVYVSSAIGNYAVNPSRTDGSIYGIGAIDFAQVKYVDNNISSYHPFTIYTNSNDVTKPERAIAIVKENGNDIWHIGNKDGGGVLRDVSLYLDFKDINIPSKLNINKTHIYGSLDVDCSIKLNSKLTVIGDVSLNGTNNFIPNKLKVGTLTITGDTSTNILYPNSIYVSGQTISITSTAGGFINTANSTSSTPGSLSVRAGNATSNPYNGGILLLRSGDGGSSSISSDAGNGGILTISSGDGGLINTNGFSGGDGGDVSVCGGKGGNCTSLTNTHGGSGGSLYLKGGDGGSGGYYGGAAGSVIVQGGKGSYTVGSPYFSGGGSVFILPGKDASDSYVHTGNVFINCDNFNDLTGQTLFASGSASAPSITFISESDCGFYRGGTNMISVAINNIESFRFGTTGFQSRLGYPAWSDSKLKTNIKKLDNPLDKILQLNGISYTHIRDENIKGIGFIAQEFEKVIPELVIESTVIGESNDVLYKSIKYMELIPYLSEAIKEQHKIIEDQQKTINILINEINEIKNNIK